VFLPGWATDCRIFDGIAAGRRCLLAPSFVPGRYSRGLADYLKKTACGPVILAGWSLGGFAAVEFASRYPELVARLVLAGVRRRFPPREIEDFRRMLSADREACLGQFYRRCFLPSQSAGYRAFREGLMQDYLKEMKLRDLMEGLDYLAECEIGAAALPGRPAIFVHGARDSIAPLAEAVSLAGEVSGARMLVCPDAGHAVFLTKEFCSTVSDD
jgi:pimeloyl-ACP methyl ester carboxylesterase